MITQSHIPSSSW